MWAARLDAKRGRFSGIAAGLIAFILAGIVAGPACAQQTKTLSWTHPTERTDGTALSADELAFTRILCEPGIDESVPVPATSWVLADTSAVSCVARSVDTDGEESADSGRLYVTWQPDPDPEPDPPGQPTDVSVAAVVLPPSTGPPGELVMAGIIEVAVLGIAGSRTSSAITFGSAPHEGDLIVLLLGRNNGFAENVAGAPTGFTALGSIATRGGIPAAISQAFGRIGGSAEPVTYTITHPTQATQLTGYIVRGHNLSVIGDLEVVARDGGGTQASPTAVSSLSFPASAQNIGAGSVALFHGSVRGAAPAISGGGLTADFGPSLASNVSSVAASREFASAQSGFQFDLTADPDAAMMGTLIIVEPAASGSTVEANLATEPPVLAASVIREHTASAALSVPAPVLAGASEAERQAAADLNIAALQLNAEAARVHEISAALGITPLELAASGSVERNASVALTLASPSLAATAGIGRQVSAALEIAAPELLSDVMIERSVSAALDTPAATLAANLGAAKQASGALVTPAAALSADLGAERTVQGALETPAPVLTSQVSVVRLASGELALAVPVLASMVLGEELTVSGALQTPVPVLAADAMISRTASGALELALPVLDGEVSRETTVEAVLIVRAPEMAAQAAIARFASGELTLAELELAAQAFQGAIQPVIGLRATVRQIGRTAAVSQIGRTATIRNRH